MTRNNKYSKKTYASYVKGFTLIEVMIVVVIVGILATVVYPSYNNFMIRSNRAEAPQELIRIANLQEQLFVDSQAYTDNLSLLMGGAVASFTTDSGNYIISSRVVGNTFTLTATAQGGQATNDPLCNAITLTDTGAKAPAICWEE